MSKKVSLFNARVIRLSCKCYQLNINNQAEAQRLILMSHSLTHSLTHSFIHSVSLDMLNNFCFHVHAKKSLFIGENDNAL